MPRERAGRDSPGRRRVGPGRAGRQAAATPSAGGLLQGATGRNLGLVIALVALCIFGVITAGERFASIDNLLTILRLASVIGVISIGMTFVITGGGIDLSVGSVIGLASVWASTLATQTMAQDFHWIVMVLCALGGRPRGGPDQRRAHRLRQGGRVHRDPRHAGRRPRPRGDHRQPADPDRRGRRLPRLLPVVAPRRADARLDLRPRRPWRAGSCSTARRSAAGPSRSAATPRPPAWRASRSSATRCTCTPSAV